MPVNLSSSGASWSSSFSTPGSAGVSPASLKPANQMNHEIHEAHEKKAGTDPIMRWQISIASGSAVSGLLCHFVFLVYFVV